MQRSNELSNRRANLSGTKQAMLERYLKGKVKADTPDDTIQPRPEVAEALSCSQQRLFFLDHLQSVAVAYNISAALQIQGTLCLEALQQALDEIVRRHEVLRSVFVQEGKYIRQRVTPVLKVPCPFTDLNDLPDDLRQTETQCLHEQELQRTFDLAGGPLLRVNLIRLTENRYLLLFTLHHIISDGWSIGILIREFSALYQAFIEGRPSPLPELSIQYADFAYWQKQWLQSAINEKQLAYWQRQLQGAPDTLALPTDRPRPAQQSLVGANYYFSVPDQLSAQLNDLSRRHGVSLFATLLTVFNVLLYRYTSQQDICIGTPVANRNRQELEGLIGFFVNTLVLRSDLSGNPTFTALLKQTGTMVLDALAHQDLPFDKLVETVSGARDLNQTPLFQVMFVMQNTPSETFSLPGLKLTRVSADTKTAKFDLTLLLSETDEGLQAAIEYNTDLFEQSTMMRLAQHYLSLLQGIVNRPDQRIAELPLLSSAEKQQIITDWNATEVAYPQGQWIHGLFEQQAKITPDAVAVIFEQRFLSYAELNIRANQVAHYLQGCGIGPDMPIGICMERSLDMVIGLLGILKAGGAYVPLDPGYPQERLDFMIRDVNAPVILTQNRLLPLLGANSATLLCLDKQWRELAGEQIMNPLVALSPEHLAYCIYTSGSTGQPKAVGVPHRGILNRLQWMQAKYRLDVGDRVLQKTPFSFDVSVWEFFWPLMTGATLVMAPPEQHKDSMALINLINRHRVTTLHFVPSMLQAFLDTSGVTSCTSLKRVICSGEALPAELVRRFYRHSVAELHNLYGPTEASVDVSYWACQPNTDDTVPIGKPIANIALYILDRQLNPVPVGIAGELHIGGVGLARSYLNRAVLTAEKFIPNPFNAKDRRLYKTGDLARFRPDGNIEYLGRIDQQVKIRGFRIELGEIEARLQEHADIKEAAVLAREDQPGDKRLVAYLVPTKPNGVNIEQLRGYLGDKLPEYMMPSAFVYLEAMPLASNGKLDRKALPAPDRQTQRQADYVAPCNDAEEILAAIWADVLDLELVGIEDNFFALGGDSIRSLQVINLAKERGINITLEQLYRYGTIHALAAQSDTQYLSSVPVSMQLPFSLIAEHDRALLPIAVEDAYPLSTLQAGMIFHSEYDKAAYHLVDSIELRCELNSQALQAAIRQTVARHPVLRTAFDMGSYSEPLQLVFSADTVSAGVAIEDWRNLSAGQQQQQFKAWLEMEKYRPFIITQAPLIRFHIHQFNDDRLRFTVTEHHAILDGWSLVTMLNEIFICYMALLNKAAHLSGRQAVDTVPANALRDLVIWERAAIQSEPHRRYWRQRLADAQHYTLPSAIGFEGKTDAQAKTKQLTTLSPELTQSLQALAKSLAVPLKTVLLSAHLKVLSMLYGERNITTGLVCSVRPETADADRALGVFLNTLPFPMQLDGGSWRDLIVEVFAAEQELLKFRFYPLAQIQQEHGRAELFDAMFYYLHYHIAGDLLQSDDLQILGWDDHIQTIFTLGVAFHLDIQSGQLQIIVAGDDRKLSGAQVGSITDYFVNVLTDMAENPVHRHDRRSFLSAQEQRLLTMGWNDTAVDYPQHRAIHQYFEQQVVNTPDAIAVVFEDRSLTYTELNVRANQLAHYLIARGVGPDMLVAVCLERSLDMVVALLGILKAGGAYVPLDPNYPAERLTYMLADCVPVVLLTQAALQDSFPTENIPKVVVDIEGDAGNPAIAREPKSNPDSAALGLTAQHLAYVIYTSGSTGQPKGVMIEHSNTLNFISWAKANFPYQQLSHTLFSTSINFDLAVYEIFVPLSSGATVHLVENLLALNDSLARITHINTVPSVMNALISSIGQIPHSVQSVNLAGEPLKQALVETIFSSSHAQTITNLYGPTETTTYSTWVTIAKSQAFPSHIGRPIANTQIYILDSQLQPVPPGVPGEIYIGGSGVARGYLNRPELTAARFIPDPFNINSEDNTRLYRTGDLGRWAAGGNIEYLGRNDFQVKIRGFRIELGEIEAQLAICQGVREAIVIAREDNPNNKRLVAYLLTQDNIELSAADLRNQLATVLADYMIPSAFVCLPFFPLMPNGKLDRKRLPQPDMVEMSAQHYIAPRTATEEILAGIWAEVLGVEKVGVEDNFFELGGHSLLATQLVSRLCNIFKIELPLKMLFETSTVEKLAEKVDLALWAGNNAGKAQSEDETNYEEIEL